MSNTLLDKKTDLIKRILIDLKKKKQLPKDIGALDQHVFDEVFEDMIPKGAAAIHVKDENFKNAERSDGDKLCRRCDYFSGYSINNKAVPKGFVNKREIPRPGKS